MRIFWKLLSRIYCDLIVSGINFPAPQCLFNKPEKKLDLYLTEYILADINFNKQERKLILEAVDNLNYFCNGLIKLNITFELNPDDLQSLESNNVLLKVNGKHLSITTSDQNISGTTLGLCEYFNDGSRKLYLVSERLNQHNFRTTAIHELGHFIGLDHTKRYSIMHKSNYSIVLYPTYIDAQEFAKVWNVPPEKLRYFKF